MELDEGQIDYRTLSGAIIPRPIAWVSSRSEEGVDNLAPYSFFNVVSVDPPIVMFAPQYDPRKPDELKDTPANVRRTGEFAINVVTEPLAEVMNETSATTLGRDESEFDHAGIERAACERIDVARVADAEVVFECTLHDAPDVGNAVLVLGEVIYAHVTDSLTTDGKLDVRKLDAVGRLAGSYYATIENRFSMKRPP